MEEDVGLREMLQEEDQKVAKEEVTEEAKTETPEESSTPEEEISPEEEQSLKELDNDEEFKKIAGDFNDNKRWRQVYKRMKDAERDRDDYKSRIESVPEKEETPLPTEEDLRSYAEKQGYSLTKKEVETQASRLQDLLDNVKTPEDRKWLQNFTSAIINEVDGKYQDKLGVLNQVVREQQIRRSDEQARQLVRGVNDKNGTALDYDKDIEPEISKLLPTLSKEEFQTTDMLKLTEKVLATKGIELGKQLALKEQQKLNEEKKKASMETQSTTSSPKIDDSQSSVRDILEDEARKSGTEDFFTFGK